LQIGEMAKRSGLNASRIRFYEAQGLLSVPRRANGYRAYSAEALVALNIITSAQSAGFAIEENADSCPATCPVGAMEPCLAFCGRRSPTLGRWRSAWRKRGPN